MTICKKVIQYDKLQISYLLQKYFQKLDPFDSIGARRGDKAVYWVSKGQQWLVLGGTESA